MLTEILVYFLINVTKACKSKVILPKRSLRNAHATNSKFLRNLSYCLTKKEALVNFFFKDQGIQQLIKEL